MKCVTVLAGFSIFLVSCSSGNQAENAAPPELSGLPGETLAKMHCGSCHEYVKPDMLDKNTWLNRTLPEMGMRLGIGDVFSRNVLQVQQGTENLVRESIYPLTPKIHEEDYQKIVDFYLKNAPEKPLPQPPHEPIKEELKGFSFIPFLHSEGYQNNTTALGYDPESGAVLAGSPRGQIKRFSLSGGKVLTDSIMEPGVFSVIRKWKNDWYFLDLGQLSPHEKSLGKLIRYNQKTGSSDVQENLHKPADFAFSDINGDGTEDMVVCNFGFETGNLAWYDGKTRKETLIKNMPGARNLLIKDMNNDGKDDIVVLYAQGLEGISIFYNKGRGRFKEEIVLTFSPVYGSSWFELADFNKDGLPDILYANGDNADYSTTLKNYHGIRIFENKGKNRFQQTWFYPLYGATKALSADFDGDGDLDIAAIAYYRKEPGEGFVYFENKGGYSFSPATFKEVASGQWMALELGDINADGHPDIILGAHDLARKNRAVNLPVEVGVLVVK
ncbi:MAG: VCBS repeat-containing protein [Leadbetterella sp.]|nr:VCBS repeat-containing protein [Leadbetterella sp.]